MSSSIEALAMAGANYLECNIDLKELEKKDQEPPPCHLQAETFERDIEYLSSLTLSSPSFGSLKYHEKPKGRNQLMQRDSLLTKRIETRVLKKSGEAMTKRM
ncbi:hypothetical protein Pyn_24513 [Prunus yedoensis var. nudiflora]|uniref:Uncharacterized protein n=1 Tax=Prunus yedoensis var. nudiflora TaxID=2094558 RepID=A0A314USS7_PRUYE|nr:hypothetical protein Pyn_24513 [Prunus yedoensis var. nudiflora]